MGQGVVEGYHDRVRRDVVPWVPRTDGTLVDIGGGIGETAAHMKSLGLAGRVGTVDLVRSDNPPEGVDFQFFGDLEDADFLREVVEKEGPFDTVLCLDILEHLVDPWALVERLHAALAPGGHIVASIPNVRHYRVSGALFWRNAWDLTDAGILDRTHLRFFVKDTAVQLMTHSGLRLVSVASPPLEHHGRRRELFKKLTRGRLDSFIDVDYVVVVRREDRASSRR